MLADGIRRSLDNIRQLKAKSGPHYERWRAGCAAAAEREARIAAAFAAATDKTHTRPEAIEPPATEEM